MRTRKSRTASVSGSERKPEAAGELFLDAGLQFGFEDEAVGEALGDCELDVVVIESLRDGEVNPSVS